MVLLTLLIWIIERIVHKNVRAHNSTGFWRYIEMAIDPYRYFLNFDIIPSEHVSTNQADA